MIIHHFLYSPLKCAVDSMGAMIQWESRVTFLVSSCVSLLSLHLLLSLSLFEFTNTLFLALSALYSLFHYFTSPTDAIPAFLTNRRVLLASSLLALSLLFSFEAYDIGRFYRWQSILFSLPLFIDGRSRFLSVCAAITGFLSFHLISTEVNPVDTPLFLSWMSPDLRSIISCCSLIYATVLLSKEQLEPRMLTHSVFSILLISTSIREFLWPEMRQVSIFFKVMSPVVSFFPLIVAFVSVPLSILSYGDQLIIFDHSLSQVFNVFAVSRIILLLVSRCRLIISTGATFHSNLPSILLAGVSMFCSLRFSMLLDAMGEHIV